MPLAFPSHQGLVLPLGRRFASSCDALALCVGAAMPDVVDGAIGLGRGHLGQTLGHSLGGLVGLCVPAGLLLTWLLRLLGPPVRRSPAVDRVIRTLARGLPDSRPASAAKLRAEARLSPFVVASTSVAIGVLSHLFFDLLSHGTIVWLEPWVGPVHIWPDWWTVAWFHVNLPGYAEPYPFGPPEIVWLGLSVGGVGLFFRRRRVSNDCARNADDCAERRAR
jgi:hypothetical protein